MGKKQSLKENNAGLSLVELLVSIAIFSIVSIAFFEFLMVAVRHYQKEKTEVEVQYEAQLTVNQLQDLLVDAKKGVSYLVNDRDFILNDDGIVTGDVESKQLIVYDTDRYYKITWSAAQERLLYSEYIQKNDGAWDEVAGDVLMAEYVREFSVDLSSFERNNSLGLDLLFDNAQEYRVLQNVKLRNRVLINKSLGQVYGS